MVSLSEVRREVWSAVDKYWFIIFVEETDHTDVTLSLRFHIRSGLFVQFFYGQITGTINLALVENGRRIFGLDRQRGRWHMHPFGNSSAHEPYALGSNEVPLLLFLDQVEALLIEQELL